MDQQLIINQALKVLRSGGVIIFPTDTVWGIGCSLKSIQGIKKLYQLKKRDKNKPTAVLVGSVSQAKRLGYFNKKATWLAKKFWPGGLTLIVKAKKNVPQLIQSEEETVGLRLPNHPLLLKILTQLPAGMVATSANFSGQKPPGSLVAIDPSFLKLVDLVIKGEVIKSPASTVVDTTCKPFKIIRQGAVKLPLTNN